MLVLHVQYLHCEYLPTLFMYTLAHDAVGALTDLLLHPEAFLEGVLPEAKLQLPRLTLVQGVVVSDFDVVALVVGGAADIMDGLVFLG